MLPKILKLDVYSTITPSEDKLEETTAPFLEWTPFGEVEGKLIIPKKFRYEGEASEIFRQFTNNFAMVLAVAELAPEDGVLTEEIENKILERTKELKTILRQ